jgi:hypothetical protein
MGFDYNNKFMDLPEVAIIGSSEESDFFTQPLYLGMVNRLSESIMIEKESINTLENGNNMRGILSIKGDIPFNDDPSVPGFEDELRSQMRDTGSGIMSLVVRDDNDSVDIDFIKISKDNVTELQDIYDKNIAYLMSLFSIPAVRLGINNNTESQNSNKSQTLFNVYNISVSRKQVLFEYFLEDYIKHIFNDNVNVNIGTPSFYDVDAVKIDIVVKLFTNGLITLSDAVNNLKDIPSVDIDLSTIPSDIANERFGNMSSKLFALSDVTNDVNNDGIEDSLEILEKAVNIVKDKE